MKGGRSVNTLFINAEKRKHIECIKECLCTCNSTDCSCKAVKLFDCQNNPDVLVFEGKVTVGEFREKLDIFYKTATNISKNKVLYIPEIDKFSEIVQNALLKFIEDDNDRVFCVAGATEIDSVLSTIKSRMRIVEGLNYLAYEDFKEYCFRHCIGEVELYYYLTNGKIGKISEIGKQKKLWQDILKWLPDKNNMKKIFECLHLVKEKDKEDFTKRNSDLLEPLINLMEHSFYKMLKENNGNWTKSEVLRNIAICDEELYKLNKFPYKGKELTLFLIKLYQMEDVR